jgi:hypothetical protein
MSQSAAERRSSRQVPRRYGTLIGAALAAGLLTGGVAAAFGPATVSSTARVGLPLTSLTPANSVAIAESNLVMVNALNSGTSLGTVRGDIQVTCSTSGILSVTARAGTAAQAEAMANAVAESYIGYSGSVGLPAGHIPAVMVQAATSASGMTRDMRLLVGVLLGAASGLLIGVIAALANRRRLTLTRYPVSGYLAAGR